MTRNNTQKTITLCGHYVKNNTKDLGCRNKVN